MTVVALFLLISHTYLISMDSPIMPTQDPSEFYKWSFTRHSDSLQIHLENPGRDDRMLCSFKVSSDEKKTECKGPNRDRVVAIAQESGSSSKIPMVRYYLSRLNNSKDKTVRKPDYQSTDFPGHLKLIALAAQKRLALVTNCANPQYKTDMLSIYEYDEKLTSRLLSQQVLPGTLSQVGFISKEVMLGITGDKKLISLWIDKKDKKIKYEMHKFKFPIVSFALYPGSNQIALNYEKDIYGYSDSSLAKDKQPGYFMGTFQGTARLAISNENRCVLDQVRFPSENIFYLMD